MKKKVTRLELAQEYYDQEVEHNLGMQILLKLQPLLKWWFYYSAGAVLLNFVLDAKLPEWFVVSGGLWLLVSATLLIMVIPFYFKNADRLKD